MDFAFAAKYSSHGFTAVFCVWLNVLGALGGTTGTTPLRWLVNGGRRELGGEEWGGQSGGELK